MSKSTSLGGESGKGEVMEKTKDNQGKKQYVTVKEGDYECTYVVIGDKFKVLIGRVPAKKEEDKDKTEKEKNENMKGYELLSNNNTLQGYQQLPTATRPKNNSQERIQAMEEYAASSCYEIAKVDTKG